MWSIIRKREKSYKISAQFAWNCGSSLAITVYFNIQNSNYFWNYQTILGPFIKTASLSSYFSALSFQTNCMQYGRSFLRHPVFLLPLLIPFLWLRFPTFDLRLYITVATTLLLYAGHRNEVRHLSSLNFQSSLWEHFQIFPFVTNSVSVSLGSIFYPLYLAHWPVCSFTKYHTDIVSNGGLFFS